MAHVGVIGLGAMGAPMARRLLKAGHAASVFARRAKRWHRSSAWVRRVPHPLQRSSRAFTILDEP
jgi:3-hydroxyisobutyrate dehydrogenase-like beta-hydroxyacid dehydrogenase